MKQEGTSPKRKKELADRLSDIYRRINEIEDEYKQLDVERAEVQKLLVKEDRRIFHENPIPDATTKVGQVFRVMAREPDRIWEIDDIIEALRWRGKGTERARTRVRVYVYKLLERPLIERVRRGGFQALPFAVETWKAS